MSWRGRESGHPHRGQGLMRPAAILVPLSGNRPVERPEIPHHPENTFRTQAAEIERLVEENRMLASTQGALSEELVAAKREVDRMKAHLKSTQTESDIQMRILLDKVSKFEADIRAGDGLRRDLEMAHKDAQQLIVLRKELLSQIQRAKQQLTDAHKLQDFDAQFDSLMQQHNRLRVTFEFEKGLNIEQVERLQSMEQNLFPMAREVERLRAEISIANNKAHAPTSHTVGSANQADPSQPSQMHDNGTYLDRYGKNPISTAPISGEDVNLPVPYPSVDSGVRGGRIPSSSASGSAVWTHPI